MLVGIELKIVGVTAGMVDVVERRQRPMPGARGEAGELGDLEER